MARKKDPWQGITLIIEPPSDDVINDARLALYEMLKRKEQEDVKQDNFCSVPRVACE